MFAASIVDFNLSNLKLSFCDAKDIFFMSVILSTDSETFLVDNLLQLNLLQINSIENDHVNILDIVLTNFFDDIIFNLASFDLLPPTFKYYLPLALTLNLHSKNEKHIIKDTNLRNCDINELNKKLKEII